MALQPAGKAQTYSKVKFADGSAMTFSTNQYGYYSIPSNYYPSEITGKTVIMAGLIDWKNDSLHNVSPNGCTANGKYIFGAPNADFKDVKLRYIYLDDELTT